MSMYDIDCKLSSFSSYFICLLFHLKKKKNLVYEFSFKIEHLFLWFFSTFLSLYFLFPFWALLFPSFCWLWALIFFFLFRVTLNRLDYLFEIFLVPWGISCIVNITIRTMFAAFLRFWNFAFIFICQELFFLFSL